MWNILRNFKSIWSSRELIKEFTKREVVSRYRGSYLGVIWSFLNPVLMLIIYTFVFSVVFKSKWGVGTGSKTEFAMLLFCGITTFNLFAEVVSRSPSLILSNINYVKKVVFPLEILPVVALGNALIHAMINYIVLIIGTLLFMGSIHWTIILAPILLVPLLLITLGLGWILSSLGVYFRDIGHLVVFFVQALMFMSPIFYSIDLIPVNLRPIFYLNPFSYIIDDMRRVLIWGQFPDWGHFLIGLLVSAIVANVGYVWFQKTRKGFADVL